MPDTLDRDQIHADFKQAVNMTAGELDKWLATPESKEVGWKGEDGQGAGESIGHKSGKHIVDILHKKKADLDEADYEHMRKVVGYVHRHMAQKPAHPEDSRWAYSLKNWGHDPAKKG
ncbi:DUF3140 domain-containing protein [Sphingomonas ginkgonis]|uniref:DUF3140 domain-containing protein n=1 Tax=Sphingomonas ginkgonis TaxID=2315330 RepID=A0A3R9YLN9_9SPHN|nr:DUF3140 domain-containing protein [Sphingomonas ginkgonis]RST30563.1 DUF3140 domain-containing protein [Sphingomonas ginkgonis]